MSDFGLLDNWTFNTCSLRVRSMWVRKHQGQLIGATINSLIETHGLVWLSKYEQVGNRNNWNSQRWGQGRTVGGGAGPSHEAKLGSQLSAHSASTRTREPGARGVNHLSRWLSQYSKAFSFSPTLHVELKHLFCKVNNLLTGPRHPSCKLYCEIYREITLPPLAHPALTAVRARPVKTQHNRYNYPQCAF